MEKRTFCCLCSFITLLSLPSLAAVQAADEEDMDTIVVTGKRYTGEKKAALPAVPSSLPSSPTLQNVTQQDMEHHAARDVYDALRLADNVQVRQTGTGFGSRISLRGMGTKDALILVNGQRLAGEDTATTQNLLTLDRLNVHTIDHINIVRGAAAAQYGADALSGVINIVTKKSSAQPSQTIGFDTGTTSTNNYYHFDFGQQGKFRSSFDMNFSRYRPWTSHDLGVEANGGTIGRFQAGNLQGPKQQYQFSTTYELGKDKELTLDLGYYKDKLHGQWGPFVLDKGTMARLYPQIPSFVLQRFIPSSTPLPDAKLETTKRDAALTFTGKGAKDDYMLHTFYSKLHKFRFVPIPRTAQSASSPARGASSPMSASLGGGGPRSGGGGFTFNDSETNDYTIWGLSAKDQHTINGAHNLTFGSEYTRYDVDGDNFTDGSHDAQTYAAYILDDWQLGSRWRLTPALRYDHHSRFGSKTTPNVTAVYSLTPKQRFSATWGKGYKTPGISELYMDLLMGSYYIRGNADLRPEESRNWEVSYEGEWGKSFGKVTYFHNDIENMISTRRRFANEYTYYNIGGTSKLHGIELSLGRHLNEDWLVKLSSNWTTASKREAPADGVGEGVDGVADNVTTLQLTYDDQKETGWNVSLWQQWLHDYYESDTDKKYSYGLTNITVSRKFNSSLRAFAGVDNVFNKKIDALYLDGRLWKTGLEWRL